MVSFYVFCMRHSLTKALMQNSSPVKTVHSVHFFSSRLKLAWRAALYWLAVDHSPFSYYSPQKNYHTPKRRIWACTKSWTRPCRNWTAYKHSEEEDETVFNIPLHVQLHSAFWAVKYFTPHIKKGERLTWCLSLGGVFLFLFCFLLFWKTKSFWIQCSIFTCDHKSFIQKKVLIMCLEIIGH